MNNYGKLYEENCYLRSEQAKLVKQMDQLSNNWNKLEEWLKDLFEKGYDIKLVLDKMKEIKGGKK